MIGNLLLASTFAFCITFYAIPKVLKVAHLKKLFDIPNERKVHITPIPSLGGIAIFAGFIISLLGLSFIEPNNSLQFYILTFVVVFFFGLKDDIVGLSPKKKILGQVIAASILMFKANLLITNLHGFLGIYTIHSAFSYIATVFTVIVIMNSFNLVDGIDGLAATVSILTSSIFAVTYFLHNDFVFATIGFTFSGALIAFLIFNFPPARIFMGDTGSMLCGVVNAILVIHFINTANNFNVLKVAAPPALAFGLLAMPLMDTLRVFSVRILKGKSPFFPDRNHLHHMLLDRGLSHKVITMIFGISTIVFTVLTYFALSLGTTAVISLQILVFFSGVFFLQITEKRNKQKIQEFNSEPDISMSKKIKHVVTLIVSKEPVSNKVS